MSNPSAILQREKLTAREAVTVAMTEALPPGSPLSFTKIVRAHWEGSGFNREAVADVVMFDGKPARLRVFRWAWGWGHEWVSLDGGDIKLREGAWTRVERKPVATAFSAPPVEREEG